MMSSHILILLLLLNLLLSCLSLDPLEIVALEALADSISGVPTWSVSDAQNVCGKWVGIACTHEDHVQSILIDTPLDPFGTIPPQIIYLSHLKTLTLKGSGLSGNIPSNWTFPFLTELRIQGTMVGGPIPDLSNLPDLNILILSDNKFYGPLPHNLPGPLSILDLSENSLSGSIPNEYLSQQPFQLILSYNALTGPIPSFTNMLAIDLLQNHLDCPTSDIDSAQCDLRFNFLCDCTSISLGNCDYLPCTPTGTPFAPPTDPIDPYPPTLPPPPPSDPPPFTPPTPFPFPTSSQPSPTAFPTKAPNLQTCLEEKKSGCEIPSTEQIFIHGNISISSELEITVDDLGNGKIILDGCLTFESNASIHLKFNREIRGEERIEIIQFNHSCPSIPVETHPQVNVESEDECKTEGASGTSSGSFYADVYTVCDKSSLHPWHIAVIVIAVVVVIVIVLVVFLVPGIRRKVLPFRMEKREYV